MIISCETDARRGVPCYVTEGREAAGGQFLLRDHLELTQEDVRCQGSRQDLLGSTSNSLMSKRKYYF